MAKSYGIFIIMNLLVVNTIMKYQKTVFVECCLLLLFSVAGEAQNKQFQNTKFFNDRNFFKDTLYIEAEFIECGEWGGHEELSKIYLSEKSFYVDYMKYKADCDKIAENNGKPSEKIVRSIIKKLSNKNEILIEKYLKQVLDSKLIAEVIGNFGYVFHVYNSDSTLNIFLYTINGNTKKEYLNFIKQLL